MRPGASTSDRTSASSGEQSASIAGSSRSPAWPPTASPGTQIGYSPDVWVPLTHAPLIDGNTAMLGPASAWLGLSGVLERPDTLTMARAAIDGRWKVDRRGDTAVIRLIPRGLR